MHQLDSKTNPKQIYAIQKSSIDVLHWCILLITTKYPTYNHSQRKETAHLGCRQQREPQKQRPSRTFDQPHSPGCMGVHLGATTKSLSRKPPRLRVKLRTSPTTTGAMMQEQHRCKIYNLAVVIVELDKPFFVESHKGVNISHS